MIEFHPHAEPCHRCEAVAWELVGEFVPRKGRPDDVIECAFCGMRTRVEATAKAVPSRIEADNGDEFRFQFGRFKGMTFAEADAEPNGRRYLEILRDKNDKLRGRIEQYLAGISS